MPLLSYVSAALRGRAQFTETILWKHIFPTISPYRSPKMAFPTVKLVKIPFWGFHGQKWREIYIFTINMYSLINYEAASCSCCSTLCNVWSCFFICFLGGSRVQCMVFTTRLRSVLITECPRPKSVSHKLCIFTESAMHYEYENLQLFLGNYDVKFGKNG